MNQKPAWRHHYLPEFYLKRWMPAGVEPLTRFSRPYRDIFAIDPVFPKATAYVDRRKLFAGLDPKTAEIAEREFYAPVDDQAALALRKMERGETDFSNSQRAAWVRFVLSLLFRNPDEFEAAVDLLASDILCVTPAQERQFKRERRGDWPETLREVMQNKIASGEHAASVLREFVEMNASGAMGQHLIEMHWMTFVLPWNVPALLTSDRPILMNGAMMDDDFYLMMPVGPKRIFLATKTRAMALSIVNRQPIQTHRHLCLAVTRRARSLVFGYSSAHADFVRDNFAKEPQETIAARIIERRRHRDRNATSARRKRRG